MFNNLSKYPTYSAQMLDYTQIDHKVHMEKTRSQSLYFTWTNKTETNP